MAGGNYGGSSLPTTPIAGATLVSGKLTTYKNYKCTSALDGTNFVYEGVTIVMPTDGSVVDMVISPAAIDSVSGAVVFLCYDCACQSPMTGVTFPSANYDTTRDFFRPTIIGGGGLNS